MSTEIPERESQFWTELSHITKEIHSIEYPNYKYSPVRSHNQNKSSKEVISQNTNLDTSVSKDSSEIVSHTTSEIDISPEIDINLSEIDIDMMSEVDIDIVAADLFQTSNRQVIDKLSGFRNCTDYDYPIKLTEFHIQLLLENDFCSVFRCPFVAGNFNETVLNILPSGPNDPVNTNFIFDTKFEVDGTDQMKMMYIEGPFAINFP
ncbi:hypothetical protein RhiirA4_486778 [Rhizophagus irregularis]|uniref:Uncharacterized protein n=1 Tax=Rhizophagus irregularis TaxID=588596 RepID=A0A2I1HS11_9GLOM|nr:hypothetical protein RhiirA4_486778 [Rhizophagus irregularis]